jgi:hypothetical protein
VPPIGEVVLFVSYYVMLYVLTEQMLNIHLQTEPPCSAVGIDTLGGAFRTEVATAGHNMAKALLHREFDGQHVARPRHTYP